MCIVRYMHSKAAVHSLYLLAYMYSCLHRLHIKTREFSFYNFYFFNSKLHY